MGGVGSGRLPSPCGTRAKYLWHRKRGEDCLPCRMAANEYTRQRNSRKIGYKENKAKACRQLVNDFKLNAGSCMDCGWQVTIERLCAFDCDHREPHLKELEISEMKKNVSVERMRRELLKCDVVCSNCHRMRTQRWNKEKNKLKRMVAESNQLTLLDLTG